MPPIRNHPVHRAIPPAAPPADPAASGAPGLPNAVAIKHIGYRQTPGALAPQASARELEQLDVAFARVATLLATSCWPSFPLATVGFQGRSTEHAHTLKLLVKLMKYPELTDKTRIDDTTKVLNLLHEQVSPMLAGAESTRVHNQFNAIISVYRAIRNIFIVPLRASQSIAFRNDMVPLFQHLARMASLTACVHKAYFLAQTKTPALLCSDLYRFLPLRGDEHLASPYGEILQLPMMSYEKHPALHRSLRFYAAIEGRAQSFVTISASGVFLVPMIKDEQRSMRQLIAEMLPNPGTLFQLRFEDGIGEQLHGEHYDPSTNSVGRAIGRYAEEMTAALTLVWTKAKQEPGHETLARFIRKISGWCFDQTVTQAHKFIQEENLLGDDLHRVPNLEGKDTPKRQVEEYLRVFRLSAVQAFAKATGETPEDATGEPRAAFVRQHYNDQLFLGSLLQSESFDNMPFSEVKSLVSYLVEELALLPSAIEASR